MDRGVDEALIATSAASAILWTGSLIVIQVSESLGKAKEGATTTQEAWRYNQFPVRPKADDFRTPKEMLSMSSLVMLGIGVIAPIMGLFLSGNWLRLAAGIFAALYVKTTIQEGIFGVRVLRGKAALRADAPDPQGYRKAILGYIAVEIVRICRYSLGAGVPIKNAFASLEHRLLVFWLSMRSQPLPHRTTAIPPVGHLHQLRLVRNGLFDKLAQGIPMPRMGQVLTTPDA